MREEWYVVPARYAFKLREVVDPEPEGEAPILGEDEDALLEGLRTASYSKGEAVDDDAGDHTPPAPRHLPRTARGHVKR